MALDKTVGLWSAPQPEPAKKIEWPGWETVRVIGRGSFGTVYEIQRDVFGDVEKAALKVISIPQNESDLEELYYEGHDSESITQTFREHLQSIVGEYSMMRKMSKCHHIVRSEDIRYIQQDNGVGWEIFIKMELLTPLMKALPEKIPERTVRKIAADICGALVTCKEYGVIHRDIKPQNIFVSDSGEYKLGDFGIAKTVEKTMGGTKIGTYKYMAPEVYNNQPYGSAADIYSLGIVMYWLLNERRAPFLPLPPARVSASMEENARIRRFRGEQLPPPAHGSEELKRIVLKACAYDPKDRYASAAEMLRDLKEGFTDPETLRKQEEERREAEEKAAKERRFREEAQRAEQERRAKEKAEREAREQAERERLEMESLDKTVALFRNNRTEEQDKTVVLTETDQTVVLPKEKSREEEVQEKTDEASQPDESDRLVKLWRYRAMISGAIAVILIAIFVSCLPRGFKEIDGNVYYYRCGIKQTGATKIGEHIVYYDKDGVAMTGWNEIDGKTYYLGNAGAVMMERRVTDSGVYYLGNDGSVLTGWQNFAGKKYWFNDDGTVLSGWQKLEDKTYYFGNDGVVLTGWQKIDGDDFFFDPDGVLVGLHTIMDCFGDDRNLWLRLQELEGNAYDLSSNRAICSDWWNKYDPPYTTQYISLLREISIMTAG